MIYLIVPFRKNHVIRVLAGLLLFGCVQWLPDSAGKWRPRPAENIQLVQHENYMLGYHEASEQAAWVLYELRDADLSGKRWERADNFREDPTVHTGSASLADYRRSGYDRGHLAPAADMAFSEEAMSESFYLSNMSPQVPAFNRGIWRKLEALVRSWALRYGRLIIVTAGVVSAEPFDTRESIGENQVWVPRHYYKIVYDPQRQLMLAFLLENRGYEMPQQLSRFATEVDEVEKLTGLDFFPRLPDILEEMLESSTDTAAWDWNAKP